MLWTDRGLCCVSSELTEEWFTSTGECSSDKKGAWECESDTLTCPYVNNAVSDVKGGRAHQVHIRWPSV